jgi:hypothetical protein
MTLPPHGGGRARAPARDPARHGSIARLPRPRYRRSQRGRYHTDRQPGDGAEYTGSIPRGVDMLDGSPGVGGSACRASCTPSRCTATVPYWRKQVLFTIRISYRCYDLGCLGAPFCNQGEGWSGGITLSRS